MIILVFLPVQIVARVKRALVTSKHVRHVRWSNIAIEIAKLHIVPNTKKLFRHLATCGAQIMLWGCSICTPVDAAMNSIKLIFTRSFKK